MAEENKIRDVVDAVTGVAKAIPVYQDLAQPALQEVGKGLQTVAKTVHIALAPISALVWGYDQIKDFVSTNVTERLKNIPQENIITPEPNIAGPALESLRYTGHKEELREMYASLLATAMNSDTAENAHPSFVEIIKQLSTHEALILENLAHVNTVPMIDLRDQNDNPPGGGWWVIKHFSMLAVNVGCNSYELGSAYMVNLQRLGLIELRENYTLTTVNGVNPYEKLINHEIIVTKSQEISKVQGHRPDIWKGAINLTPLGIQFSHACIYGFD
jgi:hypothetical protein